MIAEWCSQRTGYDHRYDCTQACILQSNTRRYTLPVMQTRKNDTRFRVGRSTRGAGLGLFATADIKKGDFIIEYTGEKISSDEADERGGKYLFTLNKKWVIDGKGRGNLARYINHSCRPNAEAEIDEDDWKINIYARRNIRAGEEIAYYYGKAYWKDHIKPHGCRCEKCRGEK